MSKGERVTDEHLRTHCRPGAGASTCRYLTVNGDGWGCLKLDHALATAVDRRVSAGFMVARGDNCEGRALPGRSKEELH